MTKNVDYLKQVYDLCIELYNFEKYLNFKPNNKVKGYLIDKESFDKKIINIL